MNVGYEIKLIGKWIFKNLQQKNEKKKLSLISSSFSKQIRPEFVMCYEGE